MKTHMFQEPDQHVMLVSREAKKPADAVCTGSSFGGQALYRVAPSGAEAETPFAVAKGEVLFITDVEWYATLNSEKTGTRTVHLRIAVGGTTVFVSRNVTFDFDRKGMPGSCEQLSSGIQVASGAAICPAVHELGGDSGGSAPDIDPITKFRVFLRGYVVKLAAR
jgi:hypothetical protein